MSNNLNATYLTHAGAAEEALAKQEGRKVQIVKIIVGTGKLPDNLDPKDQTKLIAKIDETPAFTHVGKVAGEFMSDGDLPIPDVGYNYWEIGTVTDTGVLYTYTRAIGDYVPGKNDQVSKVSRPRLYFKTQNSEVITITEDKTLQYVAVPDFEAHVMEFNAHCDATNPHPQYMHNDEHASEAEAIAGVISSKWMSCLRWMQAFKSRLSNSYSGTRTDYAASEKALSDGLSTKVSKSGDTMFGVLTLPNLILTLQDYIKGTGFWFENWNTNLGEEEGVGVYSDNATLFIKPTKKSNPLGMVTSSNAGISIFYSGAYQKVYHEGYDPTKHTVGLSNLVNYSLSDIYLTSGNNYASRNGLCSLYKDIKSGSIPFDLLQVKTSIGSYRGDTGVGLELGCFNSSLVFSDSYGTVDITRTNMPSPTEGEVGSASNIHFKSKNSQGNIVAHGGIGASWVDDENGVVNVWIHYRGNTREKTAYWKGLNFYNVGDIYERGLRVFSPNNLNISDSITSASTIVYASLNGLKKLNDKFTSGFAYSFGTNGYIKLPNFLGGLIFQWGRTFLEYSGHVVTVTYPLAFPLSVYSLQATGDSNGAAGNRLNVPQIFSHSQTSFQIQDGDSDSSDFHVFWFAVGK